MRPRGIGAFLSSLFRVGGGDVASDSSSELAPLLSSQQQNRRREVEQAEEGKTAPRAAAADAEDDEADEEEDVEEEEEEEAAGTIMKEFRALAATFTSMPSLLIRVWLQTVLMWYTYMLLCFWWTTFCAVEVLKSANAQAGLELGTLGQAISAVIVLVFGSMFLPRLNQAYGPRLVYHITTLAFAISVILLVVLPWGSTATWSVATFAFFGIVYPVMHVRIHPHCLSHWLSRCLSHWLSHILWYPNLLIIRPSFYDYAHILTYLFHLSFFFFFFYLTFSFSSPLPHRSQTHS